MDKWQKETAALQAAIDNINNWSGRKGEKPLLGIACCSYCGQPFPAQVQDLALGEKRDYRWLCSDPACEKAKKDERRQIDREVRRRVRARLSAATA
jgi:hypothetical protein